jgi:hypothetical protein
MNKAEEEFLLYKLSERKTDIQQYRESWTPKSKRVTTNIENVNMGLKKSSSRNNTINFFQGATSLQY